jgi:hypothetical protein
MDDIQNAMRAPRASLSPSRFTHADFQEFKRKVNRAGDEATARADIMSIIAGESRKQHYYASDRLFNHLEPLADGLPQPKPDLYDGAYPQQIDRSVRRDLGKHIVPCNNTSLPAAPNFFLEGKSEAAALTSQSGKPVTMGRSAPGRCTVYRIINRQYPNTMATPTATQPLTTKERQRSNSMLTI